MSYKVIVTEHFKRDTRPLSKRFTSIKNDIDDLITSLEIEPYQGIPLGRSCFKIRLKISSKGKGKSGGGRVVTCVKVLASTVFLLTFFDKNDKESITDKELAELLNQSGLI